MKDFIRPSSVTVIVPKRKSTLSIDSVWGNDYNYISDSLLHGYKRLLKYYVKKYDLDACPPVTYAKADLKDGFDKPESIGKIYRTKKSVSVLVLEPLTMCEDGEAYYFTDTTLPRLMTDSYCCHPNNLFSIGDIDEDGISEIGQYYSTCVSHYKSLYVYTLKNNQWKEIGHSIFDQHYMTYSVPFASWVKKTGKGKFEMLEISDLSSDTTIKSLRRWLTFSF